MHGARRVGDAARQRGVDRERARDVVHREPVLDREGDQLHCVLDNAPYAAYTRLVPGAKILVPLTHVSSTAEGISADDLAAYLSEMESVGLPLLAATRPQHGVAQALERGGLRMSRRSPLAATANRVLTVLQRHPAEAAA